MADDAVATTEGLAEAPSPGFVFDPTVFDQTTPDYLIPKMDQYPVSDPAYYRQLVIRDPRAAAADATELDTALDPFAPLDDVPLPQRPLLGVLLTYEQAWRQTGLALGRLVHSLSLAPGEVTKIAVTDFSRRSAGRSSEQASQGERVASTTDQGSAVQEVREAVADEAQSGTSTQSSVTSQAQMGVSGGGLLVSGSASSALSTGFGVSTATSASSSRLRADGARFMQQNTIAKSQAVRSRRATQVREVSETESQSATTRVVANYNHMHALTMMFFEVVQIFELSTQVAGAERVVFIPMQPLDFADQAAARAHAGEFRRVLEAIDAGSDADGPSAVERFDRFLAADTAQLQRDVDQQLTVLQVALGKAVRTFDWHRPIRFGAMIDADIDMFLGEARRLVTEREQLVAGTGAEDAGLAPARADLEAVEDAYADYRARRHSLAETLRILDVFRANQDWFNRVLWMRVDPARYQRLVADRSFAGTPLGHLMDPRPLGVYGNYVAFRLPHATAGGDAAFADRYVHQPGDPNVPQDFVALPSGGVFGEAVLGQSVAAEKIDLTRFWNWQESPIPILPPAMQPLDLASRARGMDFSRVDLDAALTELLQPAFPDPVELDGVVAKVRDGFRDMSGSGGLQALLSAQVAATQAGAEAAGAQAVQTGRNIQDFAVGLANSELAKVAATAVTARGGAVSATVLGGVLGGSRPLRGNGAAVPDDDPGPAT